MEATVWLFAGAIFAVLPALGIMAMQFGHCGQKEFQIARLCFMAAAIALLVACLVSITARDNLSIYTRLSLSLLTGLVLVSALRWCLSWIKTREQITCDSENQPSTAYSITDSQDIFVRREQVKDYDRIADIKKSERVTFEERAPVTETLLESQLGEIRELRKFLGGKRESQLRELFDFPNMLKFNIRFATSLLVPTALSKKKRNETNQFFKNGQGIWSLKYSGMVREENGSLRHVPIPGKCGLLNLSDRHIDSKSKVIEFMSSPQMPASVTKALKSFNETLDKNVGLLLDVINEKFSQNPMNITESENRNSPFRHASWNTYWDRFTHLEPIRDVVVAEIRKHLGVGE